MKATSFTRAFWLAFLPTLILFTGWLHLIWMRDFARLAPAPRAPVWGKSYVSLYDYDYIHGNIDSYLFHTGILGFRQRIGQADLLLLGSSHVQYGLSAGEMEQKLSAAEGRPVKVFNLSIAGYGLDMMGDILRTNHIHDKAVVCDLFGLDSPLPPSTPNITLGPLSSRDFEAYIQVGKYWSEFWRDYLLDGLLPKLRIGNLLHHQKVIVRQRFLKFTVIRDWNDGDVVQMWVPSGSMFPRAEVRGNPEKPYDSTFQPYAKFPNSLIGRHVQNESFQAQHIRVIYTLIPFDGYTLGTVPPDAQPFVPLTPDGLIYYDGSHLSGRGRDAATQKLVDGMATLGLHAGPAAAP